MNLKTKIIISFLIIFVLIFSALHLFVNIRGKDLLTKKLKKVFKTDVAIGAVNSSFPFNISVRDIEVKDLFKIDEVFAEGGLFDIFQDSFRLSLLKVKHPVVTIERNFIESLAGAFLLLDEASKKEEKAIQEAAPVEKAVVPDVYPVREFPCVSTKFSNGVNPIKLASGRFLSSEFSLGRLVISDGVFSFIDKTDSGEVLFVKMDQLSLKARNLNFNKKGLKRTSFEFDGRILPATGKEYGKISMTGWIDILKRNMDVNLLIEGAELTHFRPYCKRFVKRDIESGNMLLSADIKSVNNDLKADAHLELSNIVFKEKEQPAEGTEKKMDFKNVAGFVFESMFAAGKTIALDFSVNTKMDKPSLKHVKLKGLFGKFGGKKED